MRPIIKVENLSKQYRIGARQAAYSTLRDSITETLRAPFGWLRRNGSHEDNTIWALKDVSFEVMPGEVVGVIGRNGAGKSTLLKILSRITEPTTGQVDLYGRVGSLLEVGTGFHQELSGRENVYLNGAILGMRRGEIEQKFDEIVAFAEIEKFIDTPVKHYSSGMYMRLAFAIAAHLEPEILVVDEVLAVGDAAFQKKCLGKMDEVARQGKTVLFVSHNTHALASLCQKAIWLEGGNIKSVGSAIEEVAKYEVATLAALPGELALPKNEWSPAVIKQVSIIDAGGQERDLFDLFEPFAIELTVSQRELLNPIRLVIRIRSVADESVILATTDWDYGEPIKCLTASVYTVRCLFPGNLLNSGSYFISVGIDEPRGPVHFLAERIKQFVIVNTTSLGDGIYGYRDGVLSPYRKWQVVPSEAMITVGHQE
ncbi:MAG: Vitamin B12 import ATP-binding protein BtuD [Gammaproteobacteria bacterium]|nr:Vitamin B12 import ATP-binding protein BtuD [Gammaproteobacteria bacterium]